MAQTETRRRPPFVPSIRHAIFVSVLLTVAIGVTSGRASFAQSGAPTAPPIPAQTNAAPPAAPPTVTAPAPPPPQSSVQVSADVYNQSFKTLFSLLVLAVLIESGLAVLFNWKPFVESFDARSVKPLVAFGFCFLFVETFDFDATTQLVNVYSSTNQSANLSGKILTALILAGGSSGVNNVMTTLGFRSSLPSTPATPRPPPTEAWISVRLIRRAAKGPVTVRLGDPAAALPVAGTIAGSARIGGGIISYFVRDRGRFPPSGGHRVQVPAGGAPTVKIELEGVNSAGAAIPAGGAGSQWGGFPVAAGAIIDLELTL